MLLSFCIQSQHTDGCRNSLLWVNRNPEICWRILCPVKLINNSVLFTREPTWCLLLVLFFAVKSFADILPENCTICSDHLALQLHFGSEEKPTSRIHPWKSLPHLSCYLSFQMPICTENVCIGSVMMPNQHARKPDEVRSKEDLLPLATDFIDQYYTSIKR